jgi:hypothetical protein
MTKLEKEILMRYIEKPSLTQIKDLKMVLDRNFRRD